MAYQLTLKCIQKNLSSLIGNIIFTQQLPLLSFKKILLDRNHSNTEITFFRITLPIDHSIKLPYILVVLLNEKSIEEISL